MPATTKPRLLVKSRARRELPVADGFQFEGLQFRVEPLFQQPVAEGGFAIDGGAQWYVVEPDAELAAEVNPWDYAHGALGRQFGFAAAEAPSMVEPDLLQQWTYENRTPLVGEEGALGAAEVCAFNDQDPRGGRTPIFPPSGSPEFGWYLRDDFSQLGAARDAVGEGTRKVRIGHVDTGYDPDHVTLPAGIRLDLQRNFVADEDPGDARDPARRGLLKNPGHGTGTLGILAGNILDGVTHAGPLTGRFLGGAPHAELVPVRVASSVVRFRSSAVARAFEYLTAIGADVISMSMGGVPSSPWTEAVNRAYESGVVIVCAAGNNFGGLPTRFIVYPARYRRVIAACGVMADGRPYNGLPIKIMQGNWGPAGTMETALSAYTPNMPWPELGCSRIVDMDGQGTSSATPQVAAAAALWLMQHPLPYDGWRKVEAVRRALFGSASASDPERLGRGIVRANDALAIAPLAASSLRQTRKDTARFPLLRLLTGLGLAAEHARQAMFELEAVQLLHGSKALEELFEESGIDPDEPPELLAPRVDRQIAEALAAEPACSAALRDHLQAHFVGSTVGAGGAAGPRAPAEPAQRFARTPADVMRIPTPSSRALRTYAFDPSLGLELETAVLNQASVEIPWEAVEPGPTGNYVEVVDVDPASGCAYAPVDLDDPRLLAQQGLAPSEGSPQFHQQMVYAVAMRTIRNFERALGRVALWSVRTTFTSEAQGRRRWQEHFVPRLRIYPHALREANAYYSPQRKALLFGYFPASPLAPGRNLPGGTVFTCLSHDVIAHETTHALLDGLHPRFAEPSNPDVLAFHEAFADIVALFQHFSLPEALRHQIEKTRGDLAQQNLLGELAQQFGEAIGQYGALRSALGEVDPETREWRPLEPDPNEYLMVTQPHARGALLVAAVFDAFLAIYRHRVRDLLRIATGGSGVLPAGALHPDLVNRLAGEAAKSAQHVLEISIRALDYCPPVDITFGEYLRALITADADLVPTDDRNYRVAFIEAFRRRGIYPEGVRTLSVDSLRWRPPEILRGIEDKLGTLLGELDLDWDLSADREAAFRQSKQNRSAFHRWAKENLLEDPESPEILRELGLAGNDKAPGTIARNRDGEVATEIHSVRPARRLAPDRSFLTDLVIEMTQRRREQRDSNDERSGSFLFRGGCTLLVDLKQRRIRYCVRKGVLNERRLECQRRFEVSPGEASLHATYFRDARERRDEPFAMLHRNYAS